MATGRAILPQVFLVGVSLAAQTPAIEPVLKSELAFARLAEQRGIRAAFLTWVTEDARVFTPRMTSAKAQYGPEPGDPGHLAWYPEAMGMALSGDLAWSFGPWTYAVQQGGAVLVHGHYLSVWQRQGPGQWKVVADIGVPHPAPSRPIEPFAPWEPSSRAGKSVLKSTEAFAALRQKEADLGAAWAREGGLALLPHLAKGARVLRPRAFPAQSKAETENLLGADATSANWLPDRMQMATSGDLAWTCGEAGRQDAGPTASFLRIWTLEAGTWKVLFDVRLPIPAAPR